MIKQDKYTEKNTPFVGILLSCISKCLSFIISLITVPLLLNNLELTQYSLWITLVSIITWINLLDLGVGNGLKNIVARYNHDNKNELRYYITGTFQFFLLVSFLLIILLLIMAKHIPVINSNIKYALILYIPVIFFFPFTTFNAVLQGSHKNGFLSIISLVKSLWVFILVVVFKLSVVDKIILCAVIYNIFNIAFYFIVLFSIKDIYRFSIKYIFDRRSFFCGLSIIKIGLKFFILQITSLIMFNVGNYISYNLFSTQVVVYDILNNKIFANILAFFNFAIAVFWPQIASAMARREVEKLLKYRKQLLYILVLFIAGLLVSMPFVIPFIRIWTSEKIIISFKDIMPFVVFNILLAISYYEAVVLNASEKIDVQIYVSLIGCVLFVLFIYLLRKYFVNSYIALPLANALALLPGFFVLKHNADMVVRSYTLTE
jgi:O-antigen/teichoic acid export membrane protein